MKILPSQFDAPRFFVLAHSFTRQLQTRNDALMRRVCAQKGSEVATLKRPETRYQTPIFLGTEACEK